MKNIEIKYDIYDYSSAQVNEGIIRLYKNVFGVEMKELGFMFRPNHIGEPIGVIAKDVQGKVIGHFATYCTSMMTSENRIDGRISIGFMVDKAYRGHHIASTLSDKLFSYLKEKGDCEFVIGFPNDNSYHMHVNGMGYYHIRDFQMMIFPQGRGNQRLDTVFFEVDRLEGNGHLIDGNSILHDSEMLNWRFGRHEYIKYKSTDDEYFVCNFYDGNIQILYWSENTSSERVLEFVDFLYHKYDVREIRTWNFDRWLEPFPKQQRKFHMCINVVRENEELKKRLLGSWTFYPGDCELF